MKWVTKETVTVTKTVTEFHGPLKILMDYIIPVIAAILVLYIFYAAAVGKLPRRL